MKNYGVQINNVRRETDIRRRQNIHFSNRLGMHD